jgi:hypothetical protein
MNTNLIIASPVRYDFTSRRGIRALLAVPVIGAAATAFSGFVAIAVTSVAGALFAGSSTSPASLWADAHYTDAYLTSHPLLLAACCALVVAATALAATPRKVPAALLLCAAAITPWVPAVVFLHHVWQLAPAS